MVDAPLIWVECGEHTAKPERHLADKTFSNGMTLTKCGIEVTHFHKLEVFAGQGRSSKMKNAINFINACKACVEKTNVKKP